MWLLGSRPVLSIDGIKGHIIHPQFPFLFLLTNKLWIVHLRIFGTLSSTNLEKKDLVRFSKNIPYSTLFRVFPILVTSQPKNLSATYQLQHFFPCLLIDIYGSPSYRKVKFLFRNDDKPNLLTFFPRINRGIGCLFQDPTWRYQCIPSCLELCIETIRDSSQGWNMSKHHIVRTWFPPLLLFVPQRDSLFFPSWKFDKERPTREGLCCVRIYKSRPLAALSLRFQKLDTAALYSIKITI